MVIYDMIGQRHDDKAIPRLFNYGEIPISLTDNPAGLYHLLLMQNGQEIWQTQLMKVESK